MTTETILQKYLRHLRYVSTVPHIDAVELVLRLALDDLAEWLGGATADTTTDENLIAAQGRRITELQADLERLQTAANAEVAELRQQIAQMDADNAALIRRNKELADELKQVRLDRQETTFHTISATITDRPNGTAVSIQPAINTTTLDNFASANLSPENHDWWLGLTAGRHTWRNLPKQARLDLVRYVLSFGPPDAAMKMLEFDAIRPDWMPTAGTHTKTFNMSWQQLNDFTVELEATR